MALVDSDILTHFLKVRRSSRNSQLIFTVLKTQTWPSARFL